VVENAITHRRRKTQNPRTQWLRFSAAIVRRYRIGCKGCSEALRFAKWITSADFSLNIFNFVKSLLPYQALTFSVAYF
jgi:hypothetical protein